MEKCKKTWFRRQIWNENVHISIIIFCCWRVSVNMKWMDRPSVTEMDIGGVYEMDRQTKCLKMEMPLKWIIFYKICFTCTRMCYYSWYTSVALPCFCTFRLSILEARPLSISVALGTSIHFRGTSSNKKTIRVDSPPLFRTTWSDQQRHRSDGQWERSKERLSQAKTPQLTDLLSNPFVGRPATPG